MIGFGLLIAALALIAWVAGACSAAASGTSHGERREAVIDDLARLRERTVKDIEERHLKSQWSWEWYNFCDAVHTEWLERNPPTPRARVMVDNRGMWIPIIYDGVRLSDLYCLAISYDGVPLGDIPSREHAWREIGPNDGFLTKAEAQRFLKSYLARKDAKAA